MNELVPRFRSVRSNRRPRCRGWPVVLLLCGLAAGCGWVRNVWSDPAVEAQRLTEEARQAEERGEIDQAAELLGRAVRRHPENGECHRQLARILLAQGEVEAAIGQLRYLTTHQPDDVRGFVQLAEVLWQRGQHAAAEPPLDAALELDPTHIEALLLKGGLAERRRKEALALETYHRVLAHDPANVEARLRVAVLQLQGGRPERAAPLLRSICQSSQATPDQQTEARWQLGVAYGLKRRWADSAYELARALQDRPQSGPDDWYRLAYACSMHGDAAGAWDGLMKVFEQQPHHEDALSLAAALRPEAPVPPSTRFAARPVPAPEGW